ncbi:cytochrome c oxidase subunit 2A [Paenibacillus sp. Soil750]|uniref:cytochrome c oxidase subunit 2A n=1 Tax=Paenibacillus sp. Soil750 TaxID=1736398 RepID=UPI0009E8F10F|nr:cytochrome c oxidase subunit 2A [Paenibacillus sp. Soil750]
MNGHHKHTHASERTEHKPEPSLRGTFASVLVVGLFLVISWVAVFLLFISRQ